MAVTKRIKTNTGRSIDRNTQINIDTDHYTGEESPYGYQRDGNADEFSAFGERWELRVVYSLFLRGHGCHPFFRKKMRPFNNAAQKR